MAAMQAAPDMVDHGVAMQVPMGVPMHQPMPVSETQMPVGVEAQPLPPPMSVVAPEPSPALDAVVQGNHGVQQAPQHMAPQHMGVQQAQHMLAPGAPPLPDHMMEQKAPDSGSKRNRSWTAEERNTHKEACMGKRKLTLGEKLDIVRLSESTDPAEKKNQVQLASMFEKSRSAISKILQPDSVSKLKDIAASGVCTGVKRFIQVFFFTLVTGPRRSLSLKLSDTRVYEPHIRARLGTIQGVKRFVR